MFYLSNDKQRLRSTSDANRFEMTESFRKNRKFNFRSFQTTELIFIVETPNEDFDVVKRVTLPAKTVESGST